MGLSKDNIDVIEENKNLELSTAQKRRLRRKKLKAARAGSLDTDSNVHKERPGLSSHSSKSLGDHQERVLKKKQKYKCDAQFLDKAQHSLVNNQKSKCETQVLSNELNLSPHKPTSKDTKAPILKSHVTCSVNNQNKLPQLENTFTATEKNNKNEKKSECKSLIVKKKQKSKLNGEHQTQPVSFCQIENKKNTFDNSIFNQSESQTAANLKLNEKQPVVTESLLCNENESLRFKDLNEGTTHMPSKKYDVLIKEPIIETINTETHRQYPITKVENLMLKNQDSKPQKTESTEDIAPTLDKQKMGKIQDNLEPRKQQEAAITESKKKDTASADTSAKSREEIKAAREAKKLAKQKAKQKDDTKAEHVQSKPVSIKMELKGTQAKQKVVENREASSNKTEITKTLEPVNELKCKENIPPTDEGLAEDKVKKNLGEKSKVDVKIESAEKPEEAGKSKAELRAERRAKQEAQRAAKQESQRATKQAVEQKAAPPEAKDKEPVKSKEEKSPKAKSAEKSKSKTQSKQKVGWFQHLYVEKDKESLNNIPINSNLHPAVVKLGVQLAERVITGSNARCIALLDAIKKMVRDYSLPARTEFGRGLQPQLAAAAEFLWARRSPAAAETNALKHFRRQLTHLPANVDEFDAKKQLQEEIDRYIREQIDMAGEAISLILRNKISPGDHILTYGCSSLIERVLVSAWTAGVRFRATVAGARGQRGPEMVRRLRARGLPAGYVDISAISYVMADVQKVLVGAGALLAHGAALGAAGSALVALVARARNVPVLVACETHKFSERTHLDPLVCHEIGDPDELIDKTDPNSPLKDWRSNANLTLLNVTYDVTPPSLITAVVTELGILPCTSAPVVLRFKQSEYGM